MCGPENTSRPRGGALAVLHPPQATTTSSSPKFNADLYLQTPGKPSSDQATTASIISLSSPVLSGLKQLHVFISTTGDLTKKIDDCEVLCHFPCSTARTVDGYSNFEASFRKPLSLQIGNDGVMGRRVSLCSSSIPLSSSVIAEGIVGHNFFSQEQMDRHSQAPF